MKTQVSFQLRLHQQADVHEMAEGTLTKRRARRRAKHPHAGAVATTYPSSHRQGSQHGAGDTSTTAPVGTTTAELFPSSIFPLVASDPNVTSSSGGDGNNYAGHVDDGALRHQLDSVVPTPKSSAACSSSIKNSNRNSVDSRLGLRLPGVSMTAPEAVEVGGGGGIRGSEAGGAVAVGRGDERRLPGEQGRGNKDGGGARPAIMATPVRPAVPIASGGSGRTFRRMSAGGDAGGGGGGGERGSSIPV